MYIFTADDQSLNDWSEKNKHKVDSDKGYISHIKISALNHSNGYNNLLLYV